MTGGIPSLLWYRPATGQKGVIANGCHFHVGGTFEDIDGDGRLEVFVGMNTLEGEAKGEPWKLAWFKPGRDLNDPWTVHILDPRFEGGTHDIIFANLDGDGRRELLAIACYTATPGIFAYKPSANPTQPWKKHAIQQGLFTEGLSVGDLNGDGKLEIVCGPDWYCAPPRHLERDLETGDLCAELPRDVPNRLRGYHRQRPAGCRNHGLRVYGRIPLVV